MQSLKNKIFGSVLLSLSVVMLSRCSAHVHTSSGKVPPGQAKKMTGGKSAKAYAPGQQKKK